MTSSLRTYLSLLLFVVVSFARTAAAASVTVAWDANTEPTVVGYIVQYGETAGAYTQQVNVGNALSWTASGLVEGKTYYFAVQAYTSEGVLSPLSSPVSATIPGGTTTGGTTTGGTTTGGTTTGGTTTTQTPQPIAQFTTVPGSDGRLASPTLRWTSVSDAVAYYLYVGTVPGAKNVVDTGEIGQTSFTISNVASEQVLYARLWTKQGSLWQFTDMSFTLPASAAPAQILSPLNGETNVSSVRMFQWTPVADAVAYYLYVGTTSGAKDVVNTGEILMTSWTAPSMPMGKHLYARIWTKLGNTWYSREIEFDTAPGARLVNPSDGASDVSATEVFRWTAVSGARAYYLQVGSQPGAKDVVDSGETTATSYEVNGLAPGQTLYGRLWTSIGTTWVAASDITFKTGLTARLTQPVDNSDTGLAPAFKWTPILGADAYYLYVGGVQGAKNVVDTGETHALEYPTGALPARSTLYARMWTKLDGLWRFQDSAFRITGGALTSLADGGTTTSSHLFQWTAVSNAQCYYLYVGDTPGAKNLVDTGEIAQTYWPASLPTGKTLYATLWTKVNGLWTPVQSSFFVTQ